MVGPGRPWVAALLAVLQPGLGHAYLRRWVRASLWFGLWLVTVGLVAPVGGAETVGEAALALAGALSDLRLPGAVALGSVLAFGASDAYRLAAGRGRDDGDAPACPQCGRETDPSLEFCQWCTVRTDGAESPESRA